MRLTVCHGNNPVLNLNRISELLFRQLFRLPPEFVINHLDLTGPDTLQIHPVSTDTTNMRHTDCRDYYRWRMRAKSVSVI